MYKPYPRCIRSNVSWVRDIPEHWEIKKVKHVTEFYTGWTPPSGNDEYYGGEYPWANISDLGIKYLEIPVRTITQEAVDSLRMKISKQGSLLFSFKLSIGLVSLLKNDMYTNEAIATFPPNNKINTSFLYYTAPVAIPMNAGINIYNAPMLNQHSIKNALLVCPPLDEQKSIAAFLDKETARIDALIQKKEQLIELLKEKRIALITQAVTKGLNPKAAMKDSGIEWIGEVPEHWEIFRVGIGFSIQLGKMLQTEQDKDVDELVPYLKAINVQRNKIVLDNENQMWASPEEIQKYAIKKGDLLVCEGGEVGRASILTKDIGMYIIQNALHRVRSKKNSVEYLKHLLHVAANQSWFDILCNKATIAHFTKDKFSVMLIPYPTHDEQQSIAYFLDQGTLRIDALISKINNSITLLHEYRSSLIHHAVTGKIDLRAYNAQN